MCLLVLQKQKAKIKEDYLKNAYEGNSDGVGYSYVDDDKVITKKYRKYNKFLKNWKKDVRELGDATPFLLHFRLATHGLDEGTINVHPFTIRQGLVFAHNGIINEVDEDKKLSDTQVFNRDILKHLKKSFLKDTIQIKLLEGFLGSSKLVFLNNDKSYKILNEELGHWVKDVWFSNSSYKDRMVSYGGYQTYGGYNYMGSTRYAWDNELSNRDDTKAEDPVKELKIPEACGWCSGLVSRLTHKDITDYYEDEEPSYLWMCDECIEIEDECKQEEEEYVEYNKSYKQVALFKAGGDA